MPHRRQTILTDKYWGAAYSNPADAHPKVVDLLYRFMKLILIEAYGSDAFDFHTAILSSVPPTQLEAEHAASSGAGECETQLEAQAHHMDINTGSTEFKEKVSTSTVSVTAQFVMRI